MNKLDFGQAISILANVGVIAGILFLVLELQQNNELLLQEAQRSRASAVRENLGVFAEHAEIFVKDQAGEPLNAVEAFQANAVWQRALFSYQTAFQQLPRQGIQAQANNFSRWFEEMSSLRKTWEETRDACEPDFVQFMEENVFVAVNQ